MALQPEISILSPRDPSAHPDYWPEFELTNVRVRLPDDPDSDRTTCLLLASENHPLTITGDLQPLPKPLSHLYLKPSSKRTIAIELPTVQQFAYGQYDDGRVGIWALGSSGWFTIAPARAYRLVYANMVEAVKVLYFIADAYREPRKTGKGRNATPLPDYSVDELFEKFTQEEDGGVETIAQAAERIYKHRDFLMASMMQRKEGIDWTKNPVYVHLRKRFAAEHKDILKRLAGPSKKSMSKARARQASVETTSTTSGSKRRPGRPPKKAQTDAISISSGSVAAAPEKNTRSAGALSEPKDKPLPGRRTRSNPATAEEQVDEVAQEGAPAATPIREDTEEDEEEEVYPRKGKSVLRLKPTVGSKGTSKTRRPKATDTLDEAEADPPSSPTAAKRKADDADQSDHDQLHEPKRRHSRPDESLDEGIDMPTSPSNHTSTPDATLGAVGEDSDQETLPPPHLNHTPDSVQEDTWRCALDGCTHKVYSASQPDAQRLIREHYALHAYDDDQRVKMVKRLQAPSLPVERLMEKVKFQARAEGFPGSVAGSRVAGTRFPPSVGVVQKY